MTLSNGEVVKLLVLFNVLLHDTTASLQQARSAEERAKLEEYQGTLRWWITRLSRMEPESEDAHGGE